MIIYAVSLTVDKTIYSEYMLWLNQHIKEVVQVAGFMGAELLEEHETVANDPFFYVVVHYSLESLACLEHYFSHHALQFRTESRKLFGDKYTPTRKVFSVVNKC